MRAARENCWFTGLFGDAHLLFITGKNCAWPQGVSPEPIACPLCLRFVRLLSNHATSCATDRVLQHWPRRRRIFWRVTDGRCKSGGLNFAKPRSNKSASGPSIAATGAIGLDGRVRSTAEIGCAFRSFETVGTRGEARRNQPAITPSMGAQDRPRLSATALLVIWPR